jgi:hypothetical protein
VHRVGVVALLVERDDEGCVVGQRLSSVVVDLAARRVTDVDGKRDERTIVFAGPEVVRIRVRDRRDGQPDAVA